MPTDERFEERLREHYTGHDDGGPSPEEIRETLGPRNGPGSNPVPLRPRILRIAVAAAVLVAAVLSLRTLLGLSRPADSPAKDVSNLPLLSVPPCPDWARERYRAEIRFEKGRPTARLFYEPEGGGRSEIVLGPDIPLPPPTGQNHLQQVAVLLAAPAGESWWKVLSPVLDRETGVLNASIYLAGRTRSDRLGAVPLYVHPPQAVWDLGAAITPLDWVGGAPGAVSIRIQDTKAGVRYRWTTYVIGKRPSLNLAPWKEDVTVPRGSPAPTPFLPQLVDYLKRDHMTSNPAYQDVVLLDIGRNVRYGDVLRAVECGGGDPRNVFVPAGADRFGFQLPDPASPADAEGLSEREEAVPVARIHFTRTPPVRVRPWAPGPSPTSRWVRARVIAPSTTPWSVCRDAIRKAWADGLVVELAFAPEAAERFRWVVVPRAGSAEKRIEVKPGQAADVAGKEVVLLSPDDATAGQVFPQILHLLRLGATGFDFR